MLFLLAPSCATLKVDKSKNNLKISKQKSEVIQVASQVKIVDESVLNCSLDGWSLEEKLGQLLWIGVKKPEDILKFKPSGVVLFKWNYKNLKQLQSFNWALQELAKRT